MEEKAVRMTSVKCDVVSTVDKASGELKRGAFFNTITLVAANFRSIIAEACDWIHEMKDGRIMASHARGSRSSTF